MTDNEAFKDEVLMQENRNLLIVQRALEGALKKVFGEGVDTQRFIDTKRIPLICKDIQEILKNQEEVKNALTKKEDDHEVRLRILETFKNQMDGKADKNSVWLAYVFSGASALVGIVLHFWK